MNCTRQHCLQFALLTTLLAAGCGFHLPEADYGTLLAGGVTVSGGENTEEFLPELQAALRSAGADENGDDWQVELQSYREKQRILQVDPRGRAAEYFLESIIKFRLIQRGGEAGEAQELYVSRHMRHSLQGLSDAEATEIFYRNEMRKALARRLVERLAEYARAVAGH